MKDFIFPTLITLSMAALVFIIVFFVAWKPMHDTSNTRQAGLLEDRQCLRLAGQKRVERSHSR